AKNLERSDALEEYARKRLGKVDRRLKRQDIPFHLVLRQEGARKAEDRFVAELTGSLRGGFVLRGEERGPDIYTAIDQVSDVVERQIRRYKTQRDRKRHGGVSLPEWEAGLLGEFSAEEAATTERPAPVAAPAATGVADDLDVQALGDGNVVRTKRHDVKPMSVDEAAAQMSLLGHTCFVFLNSENNDINVLYRRSDGDYGLIVPDR
ncbi:MAG: ribosome hibernation-promoting factor, HPF/YfiA family, partial [Chloroflexota bacterium]